MPDRRPRVPPDVLEAGRFWRRASNSVIDLASGRRAVIRYLPRAETARELAWEARSAALQSSAAPSHTLIDYGWLPDGRRFEAWSAAVGRFRTAGGDRRRREPAAARLRARRAGTFAVDRGRVLATLLDDLESPRVGVHVVRFPARGSASAGRLLDTLASAARARGFVPVSLAVLARHPPALEALAGRQTLLIVRAGEPTRADRRRAVAALLAIGLSSVRSHLLLEADRPRAGPRLAEWRRGGPVFVHESSAGAWNPHASTAAAAAQPPAGRPDRHAARAEAGVLRAVTLVSRGRHSAAARALGAALAGFARRGRAADAGRAAIALGRLALERGRVEEAAATFDRARQWFDAADTPDASIEAAAWIGLARTDAGLLTDAEAALRAAAAASGWAATGCGTRAALALARCLFWQGRRLEAADWLTRAGGAAGPLAPIAARLASRLALARGDLGRAGAEARRALELARALGDGREVCSAHAVLAAVAGAVGDVDAVCRHLVDGRAAARRTGAPLRLLRLRLSAMEAFHAGGRTVESAALARHLARVARAGGRLPALLAARLQLALIRAGFDPDGSMRRGLGAFIRARAARALEPRPSREPDMDLVDDLIEMLNGCHELDDEREALVRVCGRVRERLQASAAYVFAKPPNGHPIAAAGAVGAEPPAAVAHALETGAPLVPTADPAGFEAAAPVRYGGATIGALGCRWLGDRAVDRERVGLLLAAAAAVSAPRLREALDRRQTPAVAGPPGATLLLGVSAAMDEVRRAIARAAPAPFPVLVVGESGSGKELVARAIHGQSLRRDRRFCAVNCAALPDDLLEAELFGHARGAFTGALADRPGLFEDADGGTLLLDEVSELSPRAQAKLLRVLQEGEVRRVGETFSRRIDVRLVAATNRSLDGECAAGRFRRDLLYRVDVLRIRVPPLRERADDVPVLAAHFWTRATERLGGRATLHPDTLAALARYDWPGNVRELENVIAALAVRAPRRGRVGPCHLPAPLAAGTTGGTTLDEARRTFERRFVAGVLARHGGHRGRAASDLGLSRQGLAKLMARLGVEAPDEAAESVPRG